MTVKALKATNDPALAEAYLFVEVASGANPVAVLDSLSRERIVDWDAVRDARYRIVLHLHGESEEGLRAQVKGLLAAVDGVGDHVFVPVHQPELSESAQERIQDYVDALDGPAPGRDPEQAAAFLLLDVDGRRLSRLYASLYATDEVVVLEADVHANRLVAVVQSPDFAALRRVVNDRIRVLDGVSRVVEMKVIPRDLM